MSLGLEMRRCKNFVDTLHSAMVQLMTTKKVDLMKSASSLVKHSELEKGFVIRDDTCSYQRKMEKLL